LARSCFGEGRGVVSVKILLAVDGSAHAESATRLLRELQPGPGTRIKVMTVVPEHTFLAGITLHGIRGIGAGRDQERKVQEEQAGQLLQAPAGLLRAGGVEVETEVCRGRPAEEILGRSRDMQADLVVVGAKGTGGSERFPLGSVAQKVMKYAGTSVLLAREGPGAIRRVLVATDGSRYSTEAIRFLLDLPLPGRSEVILVTALQSHVSDLIKRPTLGLEPNQQLLMQLQVAEAEAGRILMSKTRKEFRDRGYDASSLILRGEPSEEILLAADSMCPELITVGAKGLSETAPFLLGSVAQRVARFSRFSVLIVRPDMWGPPKTAG
jgi:nucleotide-binding universal stress UspA family protein